MTLATPAQIASIMDLTPIPNSFAELDKRVSQGLPASALQRAYPIFVVTMNSKASYIVTF